jgi:UTP--glucose-1-phosphate uridylyltransferase
MNARFSYTRQTEMKGLGHAILSGRPLIGRRSICRGPGR